MPTYATAASAAAAPAAAAPAAADAAAVDCHHQPPLFMAAFATSPHP